MKRTSINTIVGILICTSFTIVSGSPQQVIEKGRSSIVSASEGFILGLLGLQDDAGGAAYAAHI